MELPQLLVVALIFEAERLVARVEQVLGTCLWVELLVFWDLFPGHFQDVSLGEGRNTYHAHLLHTCSRNTHAFMVVERFSLSFYWGVGLAP